MYASYAKRREDCALLSAPACTRSCCFVNRFCFCTASDCESDPYALLVYGCVIAAFKVYANACCMFSSCACLASGSFSAASWCLCNRVLMLLRAAHRLTSGALCTNFQPAGTEGANMYESCMDVVWCCCWWPFVDFFYAPACSLYQQPTKLASSDSMLTCMADSWHVWGFANFRTHLGVVFALC
jgi:hypothetical protein